jgi:hypothetical protein
MLRLQFLALLLISPLFMNLAYSADDLDPKYFIRNTTYRMLDKRVVLIERDRPGIVTMDDWPQLIFLSADGEHSVAEFIASLGKQYPKGMPPELPNQTRRLVRELAAAGYISLISKKKKLPYYLSMPMEQQDIERSKALMEADGFIRKPAK